MCVCVYVYMWVTHSATPWTVAHQAPLSKGFSRQEYWSGLPLPPPRESSWPRDQTHISCIADGFFIVWATKEAPSVFRYYKNSLVFWGKTEVHWPPHPRPLFASPRSNVYLPALHPQWNELHTSSLCYIQMKLQYLNCFKFKVFKILSILIT